MKTLAIRLDDDVANQLTIVAQLEGSSLVELVRQAVAQLLAAKRDDQQLGQRASDILAEIDQDAAARKAAIAALFGDQPEAETSAEATPIKGSRRSPSAATGREA